MQESLFGVWVDAKSGVFGKHSRRKDALLFFVELNRAPAVEGLAGVRALGDEVVAFLVGARHTGPSMGGLNHSGLKRRRRSERWTEEGLNAGVRL